MIDPPPRGWEALHAGEVTLLAQSRDGVHWSRPALGLYEIPRFPKGNVVVADIFLVTHNFTPFIDAKPGIPAGARSKAIGGLQYSTDRASLREKYGEGGLHAFVAEDGIHWRRFQDGPIISEEWGIFDSQNVAFYSPAEGMYVRYFRTFEEGFRTVRRTTSQDFIHWTEPATMGGRLEGEHLYTSGTHPYFRAPHIYIAHATRYFPDDDPNTRIILMTSRAGSETYDRTFGQEDFLPDPEAGNRTNYLAWTNEVQTGPQELSYYKLGKRYTLRLDGFASLHAEGAGQVVTKPVAFEGDSLWLNYRTQGEGSVRVEMRDSDGKVIEGFGLAACLPMQGDEIAQYVRWADNPDLGALSGTPVTIRMAIADADVFALRFASGAATEGE